MILGYGLFSGFLRDSETESAPSVVTAVKDVGIGAVTGGISGAVRAGVRRI